MQKLLFSLVMMAALGCQTKQASSTIENTAAVEDTISQNTSSENVPTLLQGSDASLKMVCQDSCEIGYQDYTIATKPHTDAPGEDIMVTNNMTKAKTIIEIKEADGAQYFNGLVGTYAVIDIGTGNIRDLAIYDLKTNKVASILQGIINDASVINGKLSYTTLLADDKVKALKLPPCSNLDLEISGYTETMTYDFVTKKSVSTQKYDCIK
jgi:hypothetical protein